MISYIKYAIKRYIIGRCDDLCRYSSSLSNATEQIMIENFKDKWHVGQVPWDYNIYMQDFAHYTSNAIECIRFFPDIGISLSVRYEPRLLPIGGAIKAPWCVGLICSKQTYYLGMYDFEVIWPSALSMAPKITMNIVNHPLEYIDIGAKSNCNGEYQFYFKVNCGKDNITKFFPIHKRITRISIIINEKSLIFFIDNCELYRFSSKKNKIVKNILEHISKYGLYIIARNGVNKETIEECLYLSKISYATSGEFIIKRIKYCAL